MLPSQLGGDLYEAWAPDGPVPVDELDRLAEVDELPDGWVIVHHPSRGLGTLIGADDPITTEQGLDAIALDRPVLIESIGGRVERIRPLPSAPG